MRHWITDDSELTGNWLDELLEELSEHLYGIAEFNRLRKIGRLRPNKSWIKFYKNTTKELLIELVYIIFDSKEELNQFYNEYESEIEEDTV